MAKAGGKADFHVEDASRRILDEKRLNDGKLGLPNPAAQSPKQPTHMP